MIEMKPCPFCGGEAKLEPAVLSARFHVDCQNCECGTYARESKAEAIAAWQSRQNISDVLIEALTKAAVWFEEYAFQHGCKATQTADDAERVSRLGKSKRNKERAEYLRDALRQAKGGEG